MHMMSTKDLSSDELDTLRRSRNPTVVLTANGEVQTSEEAQIYVHDLDLIVTVQLLEETHGVPLLGKTLRRSRIFLRGCHWSKTTVDQRGEYNFMQNGQFRTSCCSQVVRQLWWQFVFQHRHCSICLQQVQPKSEVTDELQETGADHLLKPKKTHKKEG